MNLAIFPYTLRFENAGYDSSGELLIRLKQKFEAHTSRGNIKVPSGFISDGASIPRIAWTIVGHPFKGYLPAAVVHDYLYRTTSNHYCLSRKDADKILKELMVVLGYHPFKAWLFYRSVRFAGWASYKKR